MLSTRCLPPELLDESISYLEGDVESLIAVGWASFALREIVCRYLFKRLEFRSGIHGYPSIQDYLGTLNGLGDKRRFVRSFVISPGMFRGNPRITKLSLCTIRALMDHFPRLVELDLKCFTWRRCGIAHDCAVDAVPRPLDKLRLAHVRAPRTIDPLEIVQCFSSLKRLTLYDTLPIAKVEPLQSPLISALSLQSMSVQIIMDCRVRYPRHVPIFPSYRGTQPPWYKALFNCKTLLCLQLSWTLTHFCIASTTETDLRVDLSGCTALHTFWATVPGLRVASFAIPHLVNTIDTLPLSVLTVRIYIDTAIRGTSANRTTYADPFDTWPLLWERIAAKTTIRVVSMEFSPTKCRATQPDFESRREDWECEMVLRAFVGLLTHGYTGAFQTRRGQVVCSGQ